MTEFERPTVSVRVGLTTSPRPYESIRVDLEVQGVRADNVEAALAEAHPVIERAYGTLLARCQEAVQDARRQLYADQGAGMFEPDPGAMSDSAPIAALDPFPDLPEWMEEHVNPRPPLESTFNTDGASNPPTQSNGPPPVGEDFDVPFYGGHYPDGGDW